MSESEAKGFLRIEEEFKAAVSENVASLKRVKTDEGGFLSRCTESDKIYYRELIDKLPQRAELEWGTVGFSIGGVMQCYPSDSRKSITITKGKTDDSRLADLETLLKSKPYSNKISSGKSMISFKNTDVPVADVLEILSRLI